MSTGASGHGAYSRGMREEDIVDTVRQSLPGGVIVDQGVPDRLGKAPGAYVLMIRPAGPVRFVRKGIPATELSGWLVYAGSARGGGGIAARLRRHLRPGKPVHWHVDELTNAACRIVAIAVPGGCECDIVDRLLASGQFESALKGFGSSDCRRCSAHLLRLREQDRKGAPRIGSDEYPSAPASVLDGEAERKAAPVR